MFIRIVNAPSTIDEGMISVVVKIVGIIVAPSAWVEAEKRVVREKERSPWPHADRQLNVEVPLPIAVVIAGSRLAPALPVALRPL